MLLTENRAKYDVALFHKKRGNVALHEVSFVPHNDILIHWKLNQHRGGHVD